MYKDIAEQFELAEISLNETQLERFDTMINFLQEYCEKVNLTAIRDREGIIEKHLVDSALPLTVTDIPQGAKCLDIGTGAGFPAVPIMICRPDLQFTLLDAQQKRTVYLQQLSLRLNISPEIIHGRAEELNKQAGYKGSYDIVIARAVSDLPTLLKYAVPFLKSGGDFLAMRGSKIEMDRKTEILAAKCGIGNIRDAGYSLPRGDGRRLVIFTKK